MCLAPSHNNGVDLVVPNHLSFLLQPSVRSNLPLATIPLISLQAIFNFLWPLDRKPHTLLQRCHHSCHCKPSSVFVAAFGGFNLPLAASIPLSLRATDSFSPEPFSLAGNHHIHLWCGQSSSCNNAANLVVVSHFQFSMWPLAQFHRTCATI